MAGGKGGDRRPLCEHGKPAARYRPADLSTRLAGDQLSRPPGLVLLVELAAAPRPPGLA
jgi:hypothetical protein